MNLTEYSLIDTYRFSRLFNPSNILKILNIWII